MKFFVKTIYLIFIILIGFLPTNKIASKENKFNYKKEDISNYFYGNISLKKNYIKESYKYLNEVKKYEPEIFTCCQNSIETEYKDKDFIRLNNEQFSQCQEKSIDYAVMERTDHAVVVPLDTYWSDIGSWDKLFEINKKDKNGNIYQGDVLANNVNNSYILSTNRLISAVGVSDLVIVVNATGALSSDREDTTSTWDKPKADTASEKLAVTEDPLTLTDID